MIYPSLSGTKVCMVVQQDYYIDGRVRSYAEALADVGCVVDVLCMQGTKNADPRTRDNIRVYPIPMLHKSGGLSRYLLEYSAAFVLFSFALFWRYLKNRYEVIHIHNMPDFLVFCAFLPKLFGARVILDVHDPMPDFYRSKFQKSEQNPLVSFMEIQERLSAKLANAVITANAMFKSNLIKRGTPAGKITIVMNLADTNIFDRAKYLDMRKNKTDDFFSLIYPGTIAPRYGLGIAIKAMPALLKKFPNIRLLIIGPYSDHLEDLKNISHSLGVEQFVQFKPAVPLEQVPELMSQADVGVYPALPDPHMSIATPVKVLEYAAMGLPIVASRLMVLEELFPEGCISYFEPGNIDQFVDCISNLYQHRDKGALQIENTDRLFLSNHSWQDERERYFNVINNLTHHHN